MIFFVNESDLYLNSYHITDLIVGSTQLLVSSW
jgi:hypothetical protein